MSKIRSIQEQLERLRPSEQQEDVYRVTKRQYFSLPKLNNESVVEPPNKLSTVQLYKFPQKLMQATIGFKRFRLLEGDKAVKSQRDTAGHSTYPSALSIHTPHPHLERLLDSVQTNSTEASLFQRRFSQQKRDLLSTIERELKKQDELASRVRTVNNHKPLLTSLKMKEAEQKVKDKPPEYSDFLQNIIFPGYKKEMQRKQEQKLREQENIRKNYCQALQVKIKQTTIQSYALPPECRQGCQIFNYNDKIYVLGGASNNVRHSVETLDLKNSRWDRFEIQGYRRRSFHNALKYDTEKILLVGGFREAATNDKKRLALNFQLLDLDKKTIRVMPYMNLKKIEPRYAQSSCFIEHGIILLSGGRNLQKYLKDCFLVDVELGQAERCKDLPYKSGLAHHTMALADRSVYLFGGKTGDGDLSNIMYVFDPEEKEFKEIKTHGKPHPECYGNVMHYFSKNNVLFIYGGRNDMLETPFLNQISLFHIGLSMWTGVNEGRIKQIRKKQAEQQRVRFCFAGSYSTQNLVYIYGGTNMEGYSNSITFFKFQMRLIPKI